MQTYHKPRPILFSDLPPAVTDVIDPNLKDASGYNADLGYRGNINNYINFDIGLFYQYNNPYWWRETVYQ
jgi:Fe(3+) dicitrate transport protein